MKTNPNEPAFTGTEFDGNGTPSHFNSGLTKREYFAAMALQGIEAFPHQGKYDPAKNAALAVNAADALIAELNK